MRSLFARSQDLLLLKPRWRYLIALFSVGGLVSAVMTTAHLAYPLQLAWGLTPGAPVGSEPGSIQFLVLLLVAILASALLGMIAGYALLSALLAAFTPLTARESFRAIFLSYYPAGWFSE
jgi:hypothetical protein